ncbi:hypothetical protein WOLCODRAFT_16223 [Wolfiporia cocos MD-104 SS10]|uniref:Uncharacterized protein n=1 Tax=Wolfiporia cocos (strain MD-104) TaxID=742152 RepID=A0A2H3JUZ0_WOLCO|nr:hypothetical protein WOLCODRAFT_16223 [Wolfiporia cocos MD-104 SS10]
MSPTAEGCGAFETNRSPSLVRLVLKAGVCSYVGRSFVGNDSVRDQCNSLPVVEVMSSWVALSTALVTCRFLLNLREMSDSTVDSAAWQPDIIFVNTVISGDGCDQSTQDVNV